MSFLDEIRPKIEEQVAERKRERSAETLRDDLQEGDHRFRAAIQQPDRVSLIAEFKRSSPSRGDIDRDASLSTYARLYDRYADAISILTEPEYFGGSPELLDEAGTYTDRPLLRKDFVIDPYQILEARYFGADAVLLIEDMLTDEELESFIQQIEDLGMDALVECHDRRGLRRVIDAGAEVIGVNNRDLESLEVDRSNTERLLNTLSAEEREEHLFVAESGLYSRSDVLAVEGVADAVLIGSAIMSSPVPEVKLKELTGETLVKFCGITSEEDASRALEAGADLIGLNFYDPSPRALDPGKAANIADHVRGRALVVGVFVNASPNDVKQVHEWVGLDVIQCSGDETPDEIERLQELGVPVMDATQVKDAESIEELERSPAEYRMVDAFDEDRYGGTGKRLNDSLIEQADIDTRELVAAGGLTPDNVDQVLERLNPLMVDVCSGIEDEPGIKNPEDMEAFSNAVRFSRRET